MEPTQWIEKRDAKTSTASCSSASSRRSWPRTTPASPIDEANAERVGVYIGAGLGGVSTIEHTYAALLEKGPRHGISPYFVPEIIINMAPGLVSIRFGCQGAELLARVGVLDRRALDRRGHARSIQRGDADA